MQKKFLLVLTLTGFICAAAIHVLRAPPASPAIALPPVARSAQEPSGLTSASTKPDAEAPVSRYTRLPASVSAREAFFRNSTGEWRVSSSREGFITKLSGAAFALNGMPTAAAVDAFLQEYGRDLLGVGPESMRFIERRANGATMQVLYEQVTNGLEVYGSRLNVIMDADGNIVYLTSALHAGQFPSPGTAMPPARAAAAARDALLRYLAAKGTAPLSAEHSLETIAQELKLAYRLKEESISLIYKATLPLSAPLYGDAELLVDAQTGTVVSLRPLAKK